MSFGNLCVLHFSKRERSGQHTPDLALLEKEMTQQFPLLARAFQFDSCQRKLWILPKSPRELEEIQPLPIDGFQDAEAYGFLLQVSTGLESEVRGETDVFGQLKEAWQNYQNERGVFAPILSPWMQRLFEDTKEIRSRYIQNIGGASYGSLVRKILRPTLERIPKERPILLLGAGSIARSVAPWLVEGDRELLVWNRSPGRLAGFVEELYARAPHARVKLLSGPEPEAQIWRQAAGVVVCVPVDRTLDPKRVAEIEGCQIPVIHLGGMARDCADWRNLSEFYSLDSIFESIQHQNQERSLLFARALKACEEKARLRFLPGSPNGSITLPHGWEDLLAFG